MACLAPAITRGRPRRPVPADTNDLVSNGVALVSTLRGGLYVRVRPTKALDVSVFVRYLSAAVAGSHESDDLVAERFQRQIGFHVVALRAERERVPLVFLS
jgi:hypothetical protein